MCGGINTAVPYYLTTAVQFDKRRICTDLISIRSASQCGFYCQVITFFCVHNLNLRVEILPVQMCLLSICTAFAELMLNWIINR